MAYTVDVLFFGFPAMLGLASCALIRNEKHNILFDTGNDYMFHQMKHAGEHFPAPGKRWRKPGVYGGCGKNHHVCRRLFIV
jgi:hypothetical protein